MFGEVLSLACRIRHEIRRKTASERRNDRKFNKNASKEIEFKWNYYQKKDGSVDAKCSDGSENAQHPNGRRSEGWKVEEWRFRCLDVRFFLFDLQHKKAWWKMFGNKSFNNGRSSSLLLCPTHLSSLHPCFGRTKGERDRMLLIWMCSSFFVYCPTLYPKSIYILITLKITRRELCLH